MADVEIAQSAGYWLHQSAIFAVYSLVLLVGIVSNVLFITCVAISQEKKRSVTRLLIANLAMSDVFMLCLAVFSPIAVVQTDWPFGQLLCKVTQSGSALSIFVSSFSATAIALNRYVTVVESRLRKLRSTAAWPLVLLTWAFGGCFSAPIFLKAQVIPMRGPEDANVSSVSWNCVEHWDSMTDGSIFTVTCLTMQFLVPTALIAACYGRVSVVLRKRLHFHMARAYHRSHQRILLGIRRQRRTTRTLIVMVALYVFCWMPLNIFMVALIFNFPSMANWPYTKVTYLAMHLVAISSAAYNPIVYSWAHKDFRKQARDDLMRCLLLCTVRTPSVERRKTLQSLVVLTVATTEKNVTKCKYFDYHCYCCEAYLIKQPYYREELAELLCK